VCSSKNILLFTFKCFYLRCFIEYHIDQIFKGWLYQEPGDGKCCGECKQAFCVFEDILYAPGVTWSSDNNCTTYMCMETNEQVSYLSKEVNTSGLDAINTFFVKLNYIYNQLYTTNIQQIYNYFTNIQSII